MNENELKSLEVYNSKFKDDPASFNDFQANDYIRLLKKNRNLNTFIITNSLKPL